MNTAKTNQPLLITIAISHYCEKVRWALDYLGIDYVEENHAPPFHRQYTSRYGGTMVTTIDIGTLIVSTPDVGYGRPRIAGKRFSVEQIATLTKEGLTPQQIKDEYDFLTLAEIHAALAYYYANKEQIEQYFVEEIAEYQQLLAQYQTDELLGLFRSNCSEPRNKFLGLKSKSV